MKKRKAKKRSWDTMASTALDGRAMGSPVRHKVGMAVLHCLDELLHDAKHHSDLVVTFGPVRFRQDFDSSNAGSGMKGRGLQWMSRPHTLIRHELRIPARGHPPGKNTALRPPGETDPSAERSATGSPHTPSNCRKPRTPSPEQDVTPSKEPPWR